jgi:hypothetical protein
VDTAIGALGRGEAPEEAYGFARQVAAALAAGNQDAPSLKAMNSVSREAFISTLNTINPRSYRLGSGREEPDGAFSFLVRFLGREQGITGELYVSRQDRGQPASGRAGDAQPEDGASEETGPAETAGGFEEAGSAGAPEETAGGLETAMPAPVSPDPVGWQFEDLILEEARDRGVEDSHRFDFPPYERFF